MVETMVEKQRKTQDIAIASVSAFLLFCKEMKCEVLTSHDELSLSAPLLWSLCDLLCSQQAL